MMTGAQENPASPIQHSVINNDNNQSRYWSKTSTCINENIYNFDIFCCTFSPSFTVSCLCYRFHPRCSFSWFWQNRQSPLIIAVKPDLVLQVRSRSPNHFIIWVQSTPHPLTHKFWLLCHILKLLIICYIYSC